MTRAFGCNNNAQFKGTSVSLLKNSWQETELSILKKKKLVSPV